MKGVHLFLAQGFEDMEALGTRDVLLRGGVPVVTVSVTDDYTVESSHGLQVLADVNWRDLEVMIPGTGGADVMIFPGGMPGSRNLAAHEQLMDILREHWADGGLVAAICAAPGLVVSQLDGLQGRHFTCFEGFQEPVIGKGGVYTPEPVVRDGNLITGRGAGLAIPFGLAILEALKGPDEAARVKAGLML